MHAIVVFHDSGHGLLTKFLKTGFKHCALIVNDGSYWIGFDGQRGLPDLVVLGDCKTRSAEDIAEEYSDECTIVEVDIYRRPLGRGLGFNHCVSSVKRILGVRSMRVQTPYQLYRYLVPKEQIDEHA